MTAEDAKTPVEPWALPGSVRITREIFPVPGEEGCIPFPNGPPPPGPRITPSPC